ncbi:MAG: NAD(P)-dependent oxidoreductase, partial [Actinomycetota bacterium]|nr:NAD(P)-dependent oxidoreductase [Actinomycetota bacterium]
NRLTSEGKWAQDEMAFLGAFELKDKMLGLIGFGNIGREVAKRALGFDCRIVYYDPLRMSEDEEKQLCVSFMELDELIRTSDIVSIHVPQVPETDNLISAEKISEMKPGSILINVARGKVVDEKALVNALNEGHLAGAGIDVFTKEPVTMDNPLLDAKNVILSPHIAGATNEARLRIITTSVQNILSVLRGEKPVNVVNMNARV